MSMSNAVRNKLAAAALSVGLSGGALLATDPGRCNNCGGCSSSSSACGICIWYVTFACCGSGGGGAAYAVCDSGEWFGFCQGSGGPVTYCGYYD